MLAVPAVSHAFFVEFFVQTQDSRNIAHAIDHALADIAHSTMPDFMAKFPPSYPYGNHPLLSYAHHSLVTISRLWPSFINHYHPTSTVQEALNDLLASLTDLDIALNRFHVNLRLDSNIYIDMLETINDDLDDVISLMTSHPAQNTLLMIMDDFDSITHQLYSLL